MIKPYTNHRIGISEISTVYLDANEHPRQWVDLSNISTENLNRYPDIRTSKLVESVAKYNLSVVNPDSYMMTSGSIEAIDLIMNLPSIKRVGIFTPTYDVYVQRANVHNVDLVKIPISSEGQLNINSLLAQQREIDAVIVINPNNPTGTMANQKDLDRLLREFNGIILLDEAYIEYAGVEHSMIKHVDRASNLYILRTFSKAWGLAGVRLGYVASQPQNIRELRGYQNPYSVSSFAVASGMAAIQQSAKLALELQAIRRQKRILLSKLNDSGVEVIDTFANFILIKPNDTSHIRRALSNRGVLVRERPVVEGTGTCIRVTIGSYAENMAFFDAYMDSINE